MLLSRNPSITNRESRTARGRGQSHPGMLVEKRHHSHGNVLAGIHPGHLVVTVRVLCCLLLLHTVFLSQKPWGFLTELFSRKIFGSQLNLAVLCGKSWPKYQGHRVSHSATEVAGDCQAPQAGAGLQPGAMAVVIFSLDLVVCLCATPTCPAH